MALKFLKGVKDPSIRAFYRSFAATLNSPFSINDTLYAEFKDSYVRSPALSVDEFF